MMKTFLFVLFMVIFDQVAIADTTESLCHGKYVDPITDICWDCLFPMTIGDSTVADSDVSDTDNPSNPVCACGDFPNIRVGLAMGYWEPMALVDVTRYPFCMVNMGGTTLDFGDTYGTGTAETADFGKNTSFYYVHWYIYPVIYWLNLITDAICVEQADFDIAYLTELDPTWRDDEMAFIINPEAVMFGNPIAQAACAADSIASAVGLPLDTLFWCAGSQGSMYPLTGNVQEHVGGVQASTLIAERMTYKLHREGFLWDSTSEGGSALCYEYPTPILPKTRYRYQMVNPTPTTGDGGCYPFGHTTSIWGSMKEYPYSGEDFGYLIWRKRNCCAL